MEPQKHKQNLCNKKGIHNSITKALLLKEAKASISLDGCTQCGTIDNIYIPKSNQSPQETQVKGESPISLVSEPVSGEYAKKSKTKHNPEDNLHKKQQDKIE